MTLRHTHTTGESVGPGDEDGVPFEHRMRVTLQLNVLGLAKEEEKVWARDPTTSSFQRNWVSCSVLFLLIDYWFCYYYCYHYYYYSYCNHNWYNLRIFISNHKISRLQVFFDTVYYWSQSKVKSYLLCNWEYYLLICICIFQKCNLPFISIIWIFVDLFLCGLFFWNGIFICLFAW